MERAPARASGPGDAHAAPVDGAPPRLPRTYVARRRLHDVLGRAADSAVTLLVAPPGAGKTVGVSGWLQDARSTGGGGTWLQAGADLTSDRVAGVLDAAAPRTSGGRPRPVVVDDAHLLPAATLRAVEERMTRRPDSMRLLLLSRWDLPFGRLVPELLGHLTVVRGDVLRLDEEEASSLIEAHARSTSAEVHRALIDHAQGWCAAIVLTARAVGAAPDPLATARRYGRAEPRIADRVATEVFSALGFRERHLLLCVAAEEVVTVATASLLANDLEAGEVLAGLETTGLLVTREDDERGARYRIHPLLAEVVRRRLAAGGVDVVRARATVARAVRLGLAHGDGGRAFERLVAVGELDAAAALLSSEGPAMVLRGGGGAIAAFVRRHPEVVERHPEAWFALLLERWYADDVEATRHWTSRLLASHSLALGRAAAAIVRLLRARLGPGPLAATVDDVAAIARELGGGTRGADDDPLLPLLLTELGATENWLGRLQDAESHLTAAAGLARGRGMPGLAASATAHLALTEYMAGREQACASLAADTLALTGDAPSGPARLAADRARLARLLADLVELPLAGVASRVPSDPPPVHADDLCTRFWQRMLRARYALMSGSAAGATRLLTTPCDLPSADDLPAHLRAVVSLERAFLAALSRDRVVLRQVADDLRHLGATGEAALVDGLRHDAEGDRRAAVASLGVAVEGATHAQPAVRELALACRAQLLDALGDHDAALDSLCEALSGTEARRNAVPFLGWTQQGSPMTTLLERLADRVAVSPGSWFREVAGAGAGRPDITARLGPVTATARERELAVPEVVAPGLSPREREVLRELARGSTYADIAAQLVVSENTVKTHVSSLYGKLSASRRSEALAVARRLHLV